MLESIHTGYKLANGIIYLKIIISENGGKLLRKTDLMYHYANFFILKNIGGEKWHSENSKISLQISTKNIVLKCTVEI